MEREMEKDTALTFGVGLNKNEYVLFQKTVAQFTSGKRIYQTVTLAIFIFLAFTVWDIVKSDLTVLKEPLVISSLVFFVLLFVGFILIPKIAENKRYAKGYENAVAGGQVFDGMVTINTDGITKVTESGAVTLPFGKDLLCIERREMLIFVNRFGQGIVLPARCLTTQDAADVRMTAQRNINPRFYVVKARLEPSATARMELSPVTPPAVLYTVAVQYDENERTALMKTVIQRDIYRSAPLMFLFCFLLSVSVGIDNGFSAAAIAFWVAIALFAGVKALFWVPRYRHTIRAENNITVTLNERAVVVEKKSEAIPQKLVLQWKDIAHAVESETAVEMYNKRQYVYIPKRCVGDMEFFRSTVNDKMKGNQ
ncbi:MAG: hypothetical protein J6L00_00675 [Clostridia bacterium]|nr:hypothetical protein [Clostridia bacterium]